MGNVSGIPEDIMNTELRQQSHAYYFAGEEKWIQILEQKEAEKQEVARQEILRQEAEFQEAERQKAEQKEAEEKESISLLVQLSPQI